MTIRMDVEYQEEEFNEMARSFNVMVRNVDQLMEPDQTAFSVFMRRRSLRS